MLKFIRRIIQLTILSECTNSHKTQPINFDDIDRSPITVFHPIINIISVSFIRLNFYSQAHICLFQIDFDYIVKWYGTKMTLVSTLKDCSILIAVAFENSCHEKCVLAHFFFSSLISWERDGYISFRIVRNKSIRNKSEMDLENICVQTSRKSAIVSIQEKQINLNFCFLFILFLDTDRSALYFSFSFCIFLVKAKL